MNLQDSTTEILVDNDGNFIISSLEEDASEIEITRGTLAGEQKTERIKAKYRPMAFLEAVITPKGFTKITPTQFLEERNLNRALSGHKINKLLWVDKIGSNNMCQISNMKISNEYNPSGYIFIEIINSLNSSEFFLLDKNKSYLIMGCVISGQEIFMNSLKETLSEQQSMIIKLVRIILKRFSIRQLNTPSIFGPRMIEGTEQTHTKEILIVSALQYNQAVLNQFASLGTRLIEL